VTLGQQGEFELAADELQAAIDAKPDYAEAFYTLGTVLKQQGKLQQAADALRQAIHLQPDFAGAHTTLAGVLRQLGENEEATAESKAGTQLGKEKNSQQAALFATNSGKRLLNAGDVDGAISQFKSAIQAVPGYAPAHFQLGLALQRKGEKAESAREFQKARELDPRLTPPS
jgi:tetratricopeptide (TPR) repeat protein